jgi:hypothetical protein
MECNSDLRNAFQYATIIDFFGLWLRDGNLYTNGKWKAFSEAHISLKRPFQKSRWKKWTQQLKIRFNIYG